MPINLEVVYHYVYKETQLKKHLCEPSATAAPWRTTEASPTHPFGSSMMLQGNLRGRSLYPS